MAELKGFMFIQDDQEYDLRHLPDGFVIKGNINLENFGLTKLPNLSKVIIEGEFNCSFNQLKSLKGSPLKVWGDFNCSFNDLISLEGSPQEVGGSFNCTENNLRSLKGAPKIINEDFDCSGNELTSLKEAPKKIEKVFYCCDNNLISLLHISECSCFTCDNNLQKKYSLKLQGIPIHYKTCTTSVCSVRYEDLFKNSVFQEEIKQQEKIELQKENLHKQQEVLSKRKGKKVSESSKSETHDSNSSGLSKPNGRGDGR